MKIITGASSGIGKFLFDKYSSSLDERTMQGEMVYGSYLTNPITSKYMTKVDTANLDEVMDWIHSIPKVQMKSHTELYITVLNCAAMNYDSFAHKADPYQWKRIIEVNLIGIFNVIRTILPIMRDSGYGRIINFSSVVDDLGIIGTSAYAASKAGLNGLTSVVSKENASKGITINNLRLGYFDIGMGNRLPQMVQDEIEKNIPSHKFGKPEVISRAVDFIVNNEYVNGATITIDGGLT